MVLLRGCESRERWLRLFFSRIIIFWAVYTLSSESISPNFAMLLRALARAGAVSGGARWAAVARAPALGAARLLAPPAAALLLGPHQRWFASSSSSDGPPPEEEEEEEEEQEHAVILDLAPAVADRQKGDMYRMGDVVKRWDGGASRTMCRDCPEDAKLQASYKDEGGKANQLCATHARAVGSWAKQK